MGDGPFTVAQFVADLEALRQALGHVTWWVGGGPLEYSLQASAKTVEGKQHPDRDAQFGPFMPPSGPSCGRTRPGLRRCPAIGAVGGPRC